MRPRKSSFFAGIWFRIAIYHHSLQVSELRYPCHCCRPCCCCHPCHFPLHCPPLIVQNWDTLFIIVVLIVVINLVDALALDVLVSSQKNQVSYLVLELVIVVVVIAVVLLIVVVIIDANNLDDIGKTPYLFPELRYLSTALSFLLLLPSTSLSFSLSSSPWEGCLWYCYLDVLDVLAKTPGLYLVPEQKYPCHCCCPCPPHYPHCCYHHHRQGIFLWCP